MDVRLTAADDRIDAVRGCLAIQRGPLVYAVEQADQRAGVRVDALRIDADGPCSAERRADLLDGVTVVEVQGRAVRPGPPAWPYPHAAGRVPAGPGDPVAITAVPYFAWANRGAGPMRVWLPRA